MSHVFSVSFQPFLKNNSSISSVFPHYSRIERVKASVTCRITPLPFQFQLKVLHAVGINKTQPSLSSRILIISGSCGFSQCKQLQTYSNSGPFGSQYSSNFECYIKTSKEGKHFFPPEVNRSSILWHYCIVHFIFPGISYLG